MQPFNCIIIEDEPLAAEILQDYIADIPFLKLINIYPNALKALAEWKDGEIDVIFLDLNLPKLKGFDFLQTLKNPPRVIITTAYHEFALQGYEYNVVDYLLKPIEFNRFLTAVNKLRQFPVITSGGRTISIEKADDYIFVNTNKKKVKIFFNEILYIESLKEYVKIFTLEKAITVKFQLGQIEELLPKTNFLRIHRSFIIAKEKIAAYNSREIEINHKTLPIGRSYKELVLNILEH